MGALSLGETTRIMKRYMLFSIVAGFPLLASANLALANSVVLECEITDGGDRGNIGLKHRIVFNEGLGRAEVTMIRPIHSNPGTWDYGIQPATFEPTSVKVRTSVGTLNISRTFPLRYTLSSSFSDGTVWSGTCVQVDAIVPSRVF